MFKLTLRNKQLTSLARQANTKATETNQLTKLNNQNNKPITNGFTIIEVALVLAIAAMIFLVVFLAVPALQRNQRDDARKRDVSNVVAAIETYYGNSGNGALPEETVYSNGKPVATSKFGSYLDQLSKNTERVMIASSTFWAPYIGSTYKMITQGDTVDVYLGYQCNGSSNVKPSSPRSAAVVTQLEAGNTNFSPKTTSNHDGQKFYCQDAS